MISTFDWCLLFLQIGILATIPALELIKRKERNLFAILVPVTMLVLVQGQTWWMFSVFKQNDVTQMQHLYQEVSIEGAKLANLYLFLGIICLALAYRYFSYRNKKYPPAAPKLPILSSGSKPRDFILFASVLMLGWGALSISGGIEATLLKPGQTIERGLVMYLVLLSVGKLPYFNNIVNGKRNNWLNVSLFIFVITMFLFNSRFLTAFLLLQMGIITNYCRREISRKTFLKAAVVFLFIFIVYGLYRDLSAITDLSQSANIFGDVLEHIQNHNVLDWFYGFNIEGFSGLAGLLTFEQGQGALSHDFGLSNLAVLFQFIPSSLRFGESLPLNEMREFLALQYPYTGSVVPSGMENSYAHFGLLGMLFFGAVLGYLMQWLHEQMLNPKVKRLLVGVVSVHVLQLIRGSFYNSIFYALSEIIVWGLYQLFQQVTTEGKYVPRTSSRGMASTR